MLHVWHLNCKEMHEFLCAVYIVADEVTIVTGGLLISKVRLMEEDNEVCVTHILKEIRVSRNP